MSIDPQNLLNIEKKIADIARQANGETMMGPGYFINDGNGVHTPANWCEAFAETCASMATGIRIRFPSAEAHYQALLFAGKITNDENPPEGAFIFYHWAGDAFGHITVSTGNAMTIGTCIVPNVIQELPLHHYTGYVGWAVPEAAIQAAANMPPADPTGGGLGRRVDNYRNFVWLKDDNGNPLVIGNAILDKWDADGPANGIIRYGYPLDNEHEETNDKDVTLVMQNFERNRLEFHPENEQRDYRVLLGRIGAEMLDYWDSDGKIYGVKRVPANTDYIDRQFVDYWQKNGAIDIIGLPLTDLGDVPNNLVEGSQTSFPSQVFERAILELHNGESWPVQARRLNAEAVALRKSGHGPKISG